MRAKTKGCALLVAAFLLAGTGAARSPQKKDYLSGIEADKIRDAEGPSKRIKLFLEFAADRLKKLQYELARPSADQRRPERLNGLLNAYAGCLDDAAHLVDVGQDQQRAVHARNKDMHQKRQDAATQHRVQPRQQQ